MTHTFNIKNTKITASTDFDEIWLKWVDENGATNRYLFKAPAWKGNSWKQISIPYHYQILDAVGDVVTEKEMAPILTDPGEMLEFWNTLLPFKEAFPFRMLNSALEFSKFFDGSRANPGYKCFSAMGTPQQPVVYDYGVEDGGIYITQPTNGTSPFYYSCVPLGENHIFGYSQVFSNLQPGTYEIAVKDSQNVDGDGITQTRKVQV